MIAPSAEGVVHNGALPLHYVEWGPRDAPPVVLLHGLRAYAWWFEEFAQIAGDAYRLIALDQRGRGESGWAADGKYDTDSYVADIACLVDALDLPRFALAGHSMGGTNVVAYAASHPGRVASLIVIDSAPELDMAGLTRIRGELGNTPTGFESRAAAKVFLRGLHVRASEGSLETRLDWMLKSDEAGRMSWRIDPAIFNPDMRPDPPARSWQALGNIVCPTLIMRGELSDLVTCDCADRMAQALVRGQRAEIPGAAHMVLEDNPAAGSAAMLAFLRAHPPV